MFWFWFWFWVRSGQGRCTRKSVPSMLQPGASFPQKANGSNLSPRKGSDHRQIGPERSPLPSFDCNMDRESKPKRDFKKKMNNTRPTENMHDTTHVRHTTTTRGRGGHSSFIALTRTNLRVPFGAGSKASSCCSCGSAANTGHTMDSLSNPSPSPRRSSSPTPPAPRAPGVGKSSSPAAAAASALAAASSLERTKMMAERHGGANGRALVSIPSSTRQTCNDTFSHRGNNMSRFPRSRPTLAS